MTLTLSSNSSDSNRENRLRHQYLIGIGAMMLILRIEKRSRSLTAHEKLLSLSSEGLKGQN